MYNQEENLVLQVDSYGLWDSDHKTLQKKFLVLNYKNNF